MVTVTITRRYSGFRNVCDTFFVGRSTDVDQSDGEYTLPAGYRLGSDNIDPAIIDPAGYVCAIAIDLPSQVSPRLISMAGPISAMPVLQLVE
jgi:hypothetical protein